jgi:acyl-CoA thioesterase FadM
VRFGACDPAGVVYTPEYLNLFNGVVEDRYDEALGIFYHELVGKRGTGLGYAHMSADFARPSSMGHMLDAALIVHQVGRARAKRLPVALPECGGHREVTTAGNVIRGRDSRGGNVILSRAVELQV